MLYYAIEEHGVVSGAREGEELTELESKVTCDWRGSPGDAKDAILSGVACGFKVTSARPFSAETTIQTSLHPHLVTSLSHKIIQSGLEIYKLTISTLLLLLPAAEHSRHDVRRRSRCGNC